jgi:hypothetical protein
VLGITEEVTLKDPKKVPSAPLVHEVGGSLTGGPVIFIFPDWSHWVATGVMLLRPAPKTPIVDPIDPVVELRTTEPTTLNILA